MKNKPVYRPISVKVEDVADLKHYFPSLTDYEAIRLLQNQELIHKLEDFRQDYRTANVICHPDLRAIPALEKIAIILQDIYEK